jgi:hypothetical protein
MAEHPLRATYRRILKDQVHEPLKAAGYRRSGDRWTSGTDVSRVVTIQTESSGSRTSRRLPESFITFTMNVEVWVRGYGAFYSRSGDDPENPAGNRVLSQRIGSLMDPPADYWWWIDPHGLSFSTWSSASRTSIPESALSRVVTEIAIPCLAAIVTIHDVTAKLTGPAWPFVEWLPYKAQAQTALQAASDWIDSNRQTTD